MKWAQYNGMWFGYSRWEINLKLQDPPQGDLQTQNTSCDNLLQGLQSNHRQVEGSEMMCIPLPHGGDSWNIQWILLRISSNEWKLWRSKYVSHWTGLANKERGKMEEQNLKSCLAIMPLEHQNRRHGCCRQEWCMSPNFADSEEGTLLGQRDSGGKKSKMLPRLWAVWNTHIRSERSVGIHWGRVLFVWIRRL